MWSGSGMTDYTDLGSSLLPQRPSVTRRDADHSSFVSVATDVIQMTGRAGRPQFDREGLAIILCESGQEQRYEQITGGGTILESSLHEVRQVFRTCLSRSN